MRFQKSIFGFCLGLLSAGMLFADLKSKEGSLRPVRELDGIEVEDRIGNPIPLDIPLTNQMGQHVLLSDYAKGRPTIITVGYYGCPMLCSLVLNGLLDALKGLTLKPGRDFSIVSISIDPTETTELASKKRESYLSNLDPGFAPYWNFHVAEEGHVKRLADALGFKYKKNEKTGEYMHGAAIFVVSPEGVLSRTLYGIQYSSSDLKLALLEAADGKLGTVIDRVLLSCFHYDPDSRRYGLYMMGTMRLGGIMMLLMMLLLIGGFWLRELRVERWKA